jgi:hypothetical protein
MKTKELLRAKIMIDEIIKNKAFIEAKQLCNFDLSHYDKCTGKYDGHISLNCMGLSELPKFLKYITKINGVFSCSNNQLTSLDGLQNLTYISSSFWCDNNLLTSLDELQNLHNVYGYFYCNNNKTIFCEEYVRSIIKNIFLGVRT